MLDIPLSYLVHHHWFPEVLQPFDCKDCPLIFHHILMLGIPLSYLVQHHWFPELLPPVWCTGHSLNFGHPLIQLLDLFWNHRSSQKLPPVWCIDCSLIFHLSLMLGLQFLALISNQCFLEMSPPVWSTECPFHQLGHHLLLPPVWCTDWSLVRLTLAFQFSYLVWYQWSLEGLTPVSSYQGRIFGSPCNKLLNLQFSGYNFRRFVQNLGQKNTNKISHKNMSRLRLTNGRKSCKFWLDVPNWHCFEPRTCGVGSDRSTNWATATDHS